MSSLFRITMWPGEPVAVPPVMIGPVSVEDRQGEHGGPGLGYDYESGISWRSVPEELYLREVQSLDAHDPDALAEFTGRYGLLGHPGFAELPRGYREPRHSLKQRARELQGTIDGRLTSMSVRPVAEATMYIQLVRDLTRVWQYQQGNMDFDQVVEEWENPLRILPAVPFGSAVTRPEVPSHLYDFLEEFLSAALQTFHVRPIVYRSPDGGKTFTELLPAWQPTVSLYGALCTQLANHIAESASYRVCKHCGSLFVRQRGRAEKGQHRTEGELLYCDTYHARAAAQAAYRKRQAKAKRTAKEATT